MAKLTTAQRRSQEYLREVKLWERHIETLEVEIQKQQERLTLNGVAYGENVSQSMAGDALEEGFVKLYKFCEQLDTDLIGYVEKREQALDVIANLKNPNQYKVIYLRYFEGLNFNQISNIMYNANSTVFDYHKAALSNLYRFLPREFMQRYKR